MTAGNATRAAPPPALLMVVVDPPSMPCAMQARKAGSIANARGLAPQWGGYNRLAEESNIHYLPLVKISLENECSNLTEGRIFRA